VGEKPITQRRARASGRVRMQAATLRLIREGKAAVEANPLKADNWYSLSQIYQQIIGVAEGAQQWALDSLRQAALLDPVNPTYALLGEGYITP